MVIDTSSIVSQVYTISDVEENYDVTDLVTVTPDYCPVTFSATIPAPLNDKLTFDSSTQNFNLPQFSDSLDIAGGEGSTSEDYTVNVVVTTQSIYNNNGNTDTSTQNFDVPY